MDRLMKYRLITTALLFSLITACGGGSENSDPSPVIKDEFKSTLSLSEGLPVENSALDTNSPAGIWYVKASQELSIQTTSSTIIPITITNSDSFIIITEEESGYLVPSCSNLTDITWLKGIHLSLQENTLAFSGGSFFSKYITDTIEDNYTVDLSLTNNLRLTGESSLSYETADTIMQADTNIAAIKVSSATTFSSAEELLVNFSSRYNSGNELGIDDFDPAIKCISNSIQNTDYSIKETEYSGNTKSNSSFILDENSDYSFFTKSIIDFNSDSSEINQYQYALNNDETQSGSEGCDDSDCEVFDEFTFSNSSLNNTIMAVSSVKKSNGDSLEIELSIAIK